jgi:thiamine biosynthesis lipoprotein
MTPLSFTRRGFLASPLGALVPSLTAGVEHRFHHDHVMGTSLDLLVSASRAGAEAAHAAIFDEIARLSKVLSTYDRTSEISRFNDRGCSGKCSRDLTQVLEAYETWGYRTSGAIDARIGGMVEEWKQAEKTQRIPQAPHASNRVNVDALGKAYIADRALDAALRAAPGIQGLLLNIGGDIVVRGGALRTIGIADPAARADNAPALAHVRLTEGAVATSGSYERGYCINGRYYSHLLDPRTGFPVTGAASSTVIARDGVTANALATALCILPSSEGLKLVDATLGAAALVIATDNTQLRSARFAAYEQPHVQPVRASANWPAGYELSVTLTLKELQGFRVHRPYVAVWAEDPATGKLIRNITVWANKPRWMPELHSWWARNGGSQDLYSITKPTRQPGRYRIVWDGLDEQGHPIPNGSYRIVVETNREHGDYAKESGLIDCGGKAAKIALKETGEFAEIAVEYGPHSQSS